MRKTRAAELRTDGTVEQELEKSPGEPRCNEASRKRIQEELIPVDEETGEKGDEEAIHETLAQCAGAGDKGVAPDEDDAERGSEQKLPRQDAGKIGAAKGLKRGLRAAKDDEVDQAVPENGGGEDRQCRKDEPDGACHLGCQGCLTKGVQRRA